MPAHGPRSCRSSGSGRALRRPAIDRHASRLPTDRPIDCPTGWPASATAPERPVSPEHTGPASSADDQVAAERETPSITIRIVSDDPDIVFYWLVDEPKEVPNDTAG